MRIPRTSAPRARTTLLVTLVTLMLSACGGGGADDDDSLQQARALYQFGYIAGSGTYVYGYDSIKRIPLVDAPDDTDMRRIAMAHGDGQYWLFAFRQGSRSELFAFRFTNTGYTYQNQTSLSNIPDDADTSSMAVLHDGSRFHAYLRSSSAPRTLYQFTADEPAHAFVGGGHVQTSGVPADADFSRWTVFYDGSTYRQAIFQQGSRTTLYQFGYERDSLSFVYGHNSRDVVQIVDAPADTLGDDAAILHDGERYRLYQAAP